MSECSLGHVVIIGVGLIGGSLARALKVHDAVSQITGVARSQETLDLALQLGVIDIAESDPVQAMKDADGGAGYSGINHSTNIKDNCRLHSGPLRGYRCR